MWPTCASHRRVIRAAAQGSGPDQYVMTSYYVLMHLEELGFCGRGEARHFIAGGAIESAGSSARRASTA